MTLNRLIFVGAGAVGGSIACLLAESGFPILVVARGEHGKQIRKNGLCLQIHDRTLKVRPQCVERVDQVDWQTGDVVVVATKLNDAKAVMDDVLDSAGKHRPVVCALNGIDGERWASSRFEIVLSTLVWMPATHLQPGVVSLYTGNRFGVLDTGPTQGDLAGSLSEQLCQWLNAAGFGAIPRDDIKRWKYAKWITNLGSAAQAMVTDDWRGVAKAAQAEGESVLEAANVPRVTVAELLDRCAVVQMKQVDGKERAGGSTWQSYQRGKPLETEWIEGAMADLADELGVPAPVNRFLANAARQPRPLLASEVLGP